LKSLTDRQPEEACRPRPEISVVIATYGTNGMLEGCLDALSKQVWNRDGGFEVLIVNDGGADYPTAAFDAHRNKLLIRHLRQNHRGPAAARNLGVKMAEGDIIVFLDDDSVPLNNWLESTILAWRETPDYDGIGGYVASNPNDNIYCRVNADFFNWCLEQLSPSGQCLFLVTCNAGYRKSSLEKVGGFDDRFERACGEDRDLNLKIVRGGGKLRLDRTILVYHDRDVTLTSFIKKHFHYGNAASRIYSRFPNLKHISPSGYGSLISLVWKKHRKWSDRAGALCLVATSQIATALGFVAGRFQSEDVESARVSS
jgi:glycosyltransferase involved in cell wall biosynthesis